MTLEERIQAIEDCKAITDLKASYCDAVDGGQHDITHKAEQVAALFVDGGVWKATGVAETYGHAEIRALMETLQVYHFAFHCITNPCIEVTGDTATGTWHFLVLLLHPTDGKFTSGGIYRDEFVRTDDGWRFQTLFADLSFYGSAAEGWDDPSRQKGFHPVNP